MALFNRNKQSNQSQVPAEIQQYYQAEKRERTGIAWLLAFATLIVTILLAAGIFFAGRWTYRKLAGSGNKDTAQTSDSSTQEKSSNDKSEEHRKDNEQKQEENKREEERKAVEEQKAKEDQAEKEKEKQEADRKSSQSSATTLPSGESNTSSLSDSSGNIPNTGAGDTLAIFIFTSIIFYYLHYRFNSLKKR